MDIGKCIISSVCKPPNRRFKWRSNSTIDRSLAKIIIGDFNSHSINWGYVENNEDNDLVEKWADEQELHLIYNAKLPANVFLSEHILDML